MTAGSDTAIATSDLTKRYGSRLAVDHLDLRVPAASVTGFVGPNGAGKTTTIRLLLGLARPSSGSGTVLGEPLDAPERFLPRVGALVDGPALYPQLSGHGNLQVLDRLAGGTGRLDAVLDAVGMTERAADPVAAYSLGMRQRIAIAGALLTDPELVILDEPTNGLDPAGILEMRALLRSLADEGTTVCVSSHQLAELEQICDHLVLLQRGRVRYQGSLDDLLARQPSNVEVAPEDPARLTELVEVVEGRWATTVEGGTLVVTAAEVEPGELNRFAHDHGITLAHLARRPPSLEETFRALTDLPSGPSSEPSSEP